ncbi:MAG: trehalose-6-phosphate synthase [Acidimicrobiia bacterium]|nr:trehalose-6-phosphate synthase [Acidimicrobiia bacterium]
MPDRQRQLLVVANRLPIRAVTEHGETRYETSPGGLVSALGPVMSARPGSTWVGWAGAPGDAPAPFELDGVHLVPVALDPSDVEDYYEGFSNSTLWPLYHDAISPADYHRHWWDRYVVVNQRFAHAVVDRAEIDATVWVHDYQLQLVPGMLREMRPDLRIGFFLHIPFPAREIFMRLPWRRQVAKGLLGADLVGFQTRTTLHNFRHSVPRVCDATTHGSVITYGSRDVATVRHPIGIDFDRFSDGASAPAAAERAETLLENLGSPTTVLLGVDRLDYTKGIDRRLRAYHELLQERRLDPETTTLVQIAEPSRSNVNRYNEIRVTVEQLVGEINGDFGTMDKPAVVYLHQSQPFDELIALYRLADVMVVTPFRDGMNLVAKEYVAARVDNRGVLVLSEFAGAAHQLRQAVLVNPYDIDGVKGAIEAAATMPPAEQSSRMRPMRRLVRRTSAQQWATSFLAELERT